MADETTTEAPETATASEGSASDAPASKKTYIGKVTTAGRDKTLRVEIERRFPHPRYGKIIRRRTVCHVHDEHNKGTEGDLVEIVECRPRSKTKTWELVRVVGHEE